MSDLESLSELSSLSDSDTEKPQLVLVKETKSKRVSQRSGKLTIHVKKSPRKQTEEQSLDLSAAERSGLDNYEGGGIEAREDSILFSSDQEDNPDPDDGLLVNNPDIALIVMFRSRFNDAFPPKTPNMGPQDIENGVVDSQPSPQVENLLCGILTVLLNRKKPIEQAHYNRALEEAVSTYKNEWPSSWNGVNLVAGSKTFHSITPTERLSLLKTLIMWSLHGSEAICNIIKVSYKGSRREDDKNQALSVQPWGKDGYKNRYWLVEGQDDTSYRLYKETTSYTKKRKWRSIAGSLPELKEVAEKLDGESFQASKRLAGQILSAVPRFEATEEKRKRREYRLSRKAHFAKQPVYPAYESRRTRGVRVRYNFSDDDDDFGDTSTGTDYTPPPSAALPSLRRSTRTAAIASGHTSIGIAMREEQEQAAQRAAQPTTTGSGRLVRSRVVDAEGNTKWVSKASTADSLEVANRRKHHRGIDIGVDDGESTDATGDGATDMPEPPNETELDQNDNNIEADASVLESTLVVKLRLSKCPPSDTPLSGLSVSTILDCPVATEGETEHDNVPVQHNSTGDPMDVDGEDRQLEHASEPASDVYIANKKLEPEAKGLSVGDKPILQASTPLEYIPEQPSSIPEPKDGITIPPHTPSPQLNDGHELERDHTNRLLIDQKPALPSGIPSTDT